MDIIIYLVLNLISSMVTRIYIISSMMFMSMPMI